MESFTARTTAIASTSSNARPELHLAPPSCQVCGNASVYIDEVTTPVPHMQATLLNECKRCHHRWTVAVEAQQRPAVTVRYPSRRTAVRVRHANTAASPGKSGDAAAEVAGVGEVAMAS